MFKNESVNVKIFQSESLDLKKHDQFKFKKKLVKNASK